MALVARRRRALTLPVALAGLLALPPAPAWPRTAAESEIKAAYVYHFGKFVEWPAEADAEPKFNLCVLGDDGFADALLAQLGEKKIHDKPVAIRALRAGDEARGCHVLYLGGEDETALATALGRVARHGVLVIAGEARFPGAAISFVLLGDNVRFVADVGAAHQAGLRMSSQLLKLALEVVPAEEP